MTKMTLFLLLVVATVSLPGPAWGGYIIDGFNIYSSGTVKISGTAIRAVAVQPWDGGIIIGGEFTATSRGPASVTRNNLARIRYDGTLDTSFTAEADGAVLAIAILLDPANPDLPQNNAILVGGSFKHISATVMVAGAPQQVAPARNGLARLDALDGHPDSFDPATGAETEIRAIALRAGSIVVGGKFSELQGTPCSNLAAISDSDGAFLAGFNGGVTGGEVNAIALQGAKTLAGGAFTEPRSFLVRFDGSGVPDPDFTPSPDGTVRALALQADYSLVLGGDFTTVSGKARLHLARVDGGGALDDFDPGFDSDPDFPGPGATVAALALQPDGKILAAGEFARVLHPTGAPRAGEQAKKRRGMARLLLNGALDHKVDPDADGAVSALAMQPDDKFLMAGSFATLAGGSKPRSMLARVYPSGYLDEDVSAPEVLRTDEGIQNIYPNEDGSLTVTSWPSWIMPGDDEGRYLILNPDWTPADPAVAPQPLFSQAPLVFAPKDDGSVWIGGNFFRIDGVPHTLLAPFVGGVPEENPVFSANVDGLWHRWNHFVRVSTIHHVPDGKTYLGGYFMDQQENYFNLLRVNELGERDTFTPPPWTGKIGFAQPGSVQSVLVQPDGKLILGKNNGDIIRIKPTGEADDDPDDPDHFHPVTYDTYDWEANNVGDSVQALLQLHNGKLLAGGWFMADPWFRPDGTECPRPMLWMDPNGNIDQNLANLCWVHHWGCSLIHDMQLQTDGKVLLVGLFDGVNDATGTVKLRRWVMRMTEDGVVDDLDLGIDIADDGGDNPYLIERLRLLPDGKAVIAGRFSNLNGDYSQFMMKRVAVGSAFQELTVSPDGKRITWKRGGASPEVHRVVFEDSENGEENWRPLGEGVKIGAAWHLDTDLGPRGWNRNRFVRARGYQASSQSSGYLLYSVRNYYLRGTVTVRAEPKTRQFGYGNGSFAEQYLYPDGTPLTPRARTGSPHFSTAAKEDSPVAQYPISTDLGDLKSWMYDFTAGVSTLTVVPREITVSAEPKSKQVGKPDPPLTFTFTPRPLVGDDTFSGALSRTAGEGVGRHPIVQGDLALSSNYRISYLGDFLTIYGSGPAAKLNQSIIFELPLKSYGAPDFAPDATATSSLPVALTIADASVARLVDGRIRIVGAGSTPIWASQGGDDRYHPAPDVMRTLTVLKTPLEVRADYKARAYLAPNPPLTAGYRGFVKGEDASLLTGAPLLSTAAVVESPVGDYPITVELATLKAANYRFVPLNGILSVVRSCPEIVFPPIGDKTYGDAPFELIAYSCSGLPISFTSSEPQTARVDGNLASIAGAGSTLITASQAGSGNIERAPDVSRPLLVHKAWQEVTFPQLSRKVLGDPPFPLPASASSGLAVSYQSSDPAVALVSGNVASLVAAGTAVITATQEGNANYHAALPASQPLTVAEEGDPPELTFSTLAPGSVTANPVLNVTGSASDRSGIATLTLNGSDLTGRASLFSGAVPLAAGSNSVNLSASDGAGNRTSRGFSITLDAAAPRIEVAEPADNSVTNLPVCAVLGAVSPGSSVSLRVNGGEAQALPVSEGSFTGNGYLQAGMNTLELVAEREGRVSAAKRSVTFAAGNPPLAITEPPQDLRTEQESVLVRGVAGGEGVTVTLEAEGNLYTPTLQGEAFAQLIPLSRRGAIPVIASARDAGGNSSQSCRNIVRVDKVQGDLNGDGLVDIRDALSLLRISLGIEPATPQALSHGDLAPVVNGTPVPDGKIDVGDVLVLLRKIVGLVDF